MRVPAEPLSLDEVVTDWPTLRQSLLGEYDNCPLSAFLSMKYAQGWSTSPQARGTIFHRAAAEILRTMQRQESQTIPVHEAVEILIECARQQDVPADEIVRVPLREMPELRMAVRKFAKDNAFSVHKIVDVEKRLEAPLSYTTADGERVTRRLTGQLDVLLFDPPDGSIVIDWKATFGLPPEPRDLPPDRRFDDDELRGLSFMGYFQQRFYGWLVMSNYRNVNSVTLREFFPYKTQVRKATLYRHQLPDVEEELSILVEAFDSALGQGEPHLKPGEDGLVNIDQLGWWKPQPGRHCLGGETRILTDRGVRALRDCVGRSVRVLNRHGRWAKAEVRSFGVQPLVRMVFDDGAVVRATPDHRWWTMRRNDRGAWVQTDERVTTMEIERVPVVRHARLPRLDPEGVRHGFTFGDGYRRKNRRPATCCVRIMPQDEEIAEWFETPLYRRKDGFLHGSGLPGHYKDLPSCPSPAYARGFIAGLHAADGKVDCHGGVLIHCEGRGKAEAIAEVARLGGCVVSSVRLESDKPTPFSPVGVMTRELMAIRLKPATAPVLKSYHRARLRSRNQMRRLYRDVVAIEPGPMEEVYCAVVPDGESFTLASGLVTSNCGFCLRPTVCPIPEDVRVAAGGAITSEESASRWTARLQIAERIRNAAREGLKGYVETSGRPVAAKWSKGRLVIGWHETKRGRRFGFYVPDESDRGGHPDLDVQLADAMREATARARAERGVRPRRRGRVKA